MSTYGKKDKILRMGVFNKRHTTKPEWGMLKIEG